MSVSLALHITGITMWLGGLLILTRFLKGFSETSPASAPAFVALCSRCLKAFVLPGLVIVTLTGGFQLTSGGMEVFMKQGWFHAKLTFVILLYVVTALTAAQVAKVNRGETLNKGPAIALHSMTGTALLVITLLTFYGQGR